MAKLVTKLIGLVVVLAVAVVGFSVLAIRLGWLSPFGLDSASQDTQVINAIERTQEVSLLSLGIQGLKEKEQSRKVFGTTVPGTGEKALIQYDFDAKLGVNGADVKVTKTAQHEFRVSVPVFTFIGYDDPTFKTVVSDGSILSGLTPDIDEVEMINEILGDSERQKYVDSNEQVLEEQTKVFYDSIVTGIDPDAKVVYEFASDADSSKSSD